MSDRIVIKPVRLEQTRWVLVDAETGETPGVAQGLEFASKAHATLACPKLWPPGEPWNGKPARGGHGWSIEPDS